MKVAVHPRLLKALKILFISIGSLLLLLFILPFFIPDTVNQRIKGWANESIEGKLDFSSARFSFFKEFPALTFTLSDIRLNGSSPFTKDTLLKADEISLGIDILALIRSKIQVTQFSINQADINVLVNKNGEANYNIIKTKKEPVKDSSSGNVNLRIQKIVVRNSSLNYDDRSTRMLIHATGFNYRGKGDLSSAVFDLYTELKIDSFDLLYDQVPYIRKKQVAGQLVTSVNTNSLALKFTENQLRINKLPIIFNGRFDFLDQGYYMDFSISSKNSRLLDVFTAFPPQYQGWLNETKVKGSADLHATLRGTYSGNMQKPDFAFSAVIRDGYINNQQARVPLEALNLSMKVQLPSLDPEKLDFKTDSLNFIVGKNGIKSRMHLKGLSEPEIHAKINGALDLGLVDNALGIAAVDLKGLANIDLVIDGQYRMVQNPRARRADLLLVSIPAFTCSAAVSNGYIRYDSLPESIHDISFDLNASCADSNYHNSKIKLENLNAVALKNLISGKLHWNTGGNNDIHAELTTALDCADLVRFIPDQQTKLKGKIDVHIKADGQYSPEKKQFPKTSADIRWVSGQLKTPYYPAAIEDIQMLIHVTNTTADYKDINIEIEPIQFRFENQPFRIVARLTDLIDPNYNIRSEGILDIGKIYKVFAVDGMDADGKIYADLSLRGRLSDMTPARAGRLNNSGTLRLQNISLLTENLPEKIVVDQGTIRFAQDKILFESIHATYLSNEVELQGQIGSVISYMFEKDGILTGKLNVRTDSLLLDEFQYYSAPKTTDSGLAQVNTSGIIVVPANLALELNATAGHLLMRGIDLENFTSTGTLKDGKAEIKSMHFNLADGSFNASAGYSSIDPSQALFNLKVQADSFDIQKAYTRIPMFQTMMPSAATVKGVIGMKYEISGSLNDSMMPVYPSLKGGGELTVRKASLKGFKLMNAVSRSTQKDEIRDQDVKKVVIRSTIADNVLTIKRTRLKIAGFRPRFEGQVTLDGKYNLQGRLGLPPLGIIGIPFHVTGSQENPLIKVGKENREDPEPEEE
ncbi:MAG TPA: AsmA-like C-terminal region-containing protein [Flavitalea sp.]|nr:AsmA-like C-terminal region-containing protein [Flavitalea sp.]